MSGAPFPELIDLVKTVGASSSASFNVTAESPAATDGSLANSGAPSHLRK